MSQSYIGRSLPRLEGYEELGVVVGHVDDDGLGDVGDGSGDGRGGSRLVWDLSRGRGAAAQADRREEAATAPFPQKCLAATLCDTFP